MSIKREKLVCSNDRPKTHEQTSNSSFLNQILIQKGFNNLQ